MNARARIASRRTPGRQQGVFLLEALIGILIFSFGILTMVGMQAVAINTQSDTQYRMEASKRAEEITNQISLNVDRTSSATIQTSLAGFAHNATGAMSSCAFSGGASTNALVTAWANALTSGTTALPGTSASMLQITADTTSTGFNKVLVTVCWRTPKDPAARRHSVATFVN